MRSHELAWAVCLLERIEDVNVIRLEALDGTIKTHGVSVPVVDLRVTVADTASAVLLAKDLDLPEYLADVDVVNEFGKRFRLWQGWAPEGSHEVPVSFEVAVWEPVTQQVAA